MGVVKAIRGVSTVFKIGRTIRNHIYTRRNFKILLKKHAALTAQLKLANEVAVFYGSMQERCHEKPVICNNFNKAYEYCVDYALPLEVEGDVSGEPIKFEVDPKIPM